jgi:hypothetical protein
MATGSGAVSPSDKRPKRGEDDAADFVSFVLLKMRRVRKPPGEILLPNGQTVQPVVQLLA